MRVLITGATGFLGSHLCRRMVSQGHDVRILYRAASELSVLDGLPLEKAVGDIADAESMRTAVRDREWVVHAAADLSYWGPQEATLMRVNVEGTRHVAQACLAEGVQRLLFVSSVAAIGIPTDKGRPADEDFPSNLKGLRLPYALSKKRGEEAIAEEIARGLDAVTVNPALIVGLYGDDYRGAEMMRKVRHRSIVPYFSGGICIVHVEDVVAGILAALEKGRTGHRYILGGENVTYKRIVQRTAEVMGLERRFVPVPPIVTGILAIAQAPVGWLRRHPPRFTRELHYLANRHRFYDSTKARESLGYRPRDFNAILNECLRLGAC